MPSAVHSLDLCRISGEFKFFKNFISKKCIPNEDPGNFQNTNYLDPRIHAFLSGKHPRDLDLNLHWRVLAQ